jgi:hypothetical protein
MEPDEVQTEGSSGLRDGGDGCVRRGAWVGVDIVHGQTVFGFTV